MAVDSPKKGRGARNRVADRDEKKEPPESATEDSQAHPKENWADKPESAAHKSALKLYTLVRAAFENKNEQSDAISEYWNVYLAQPDNNLQYAGNSQGYIPAVRDAINARAKRALKQLFPANNKHVEAVSSDGNDPVTQKSLLEHYIRSTGLRSIVRTDLVSGDVTGQWNLMVDWFNTTRTITKMVKRNPPLDASEATVFSEMEIEDITQEEDATEDETIETQGPDVVEFATEDLAIVPPTCTDIQKAKAVALRLRVSKERFQELIDEDVFVMPKNMTLDKFFEISTEKDRHNRAKKNVNDAGIKTAGTNKYCEIFMVYSMLDFEDDDDGPKRSGIVYFAGEDTIVGLIKNPLWSGKVPILSEPVDRMPGSFFGKSKIEPVKFLQWQLCDLWNMGQDSAMYSLSPIFAIDPLKAPGWQTRFVVGLGAIWPVGPDGITQIKFEQLWKEAAGACDMVKRQIWESMDVNEQMMGRTPAGRKNNAMVGQMQQNQDINISDHASRYEEVMLNPLLELLFEFDQQFRDSPLMIEQMGEIGAKAQMTEVPVQQWGEHYAFRWSGTEYMVSLQRMQQQIAFVNVVKGMPPQMMGGLTLDVSPMLLAGAENLFGVEMAQRILIDKRNQYALDPEVENEMLHNGFETPVHEADDDPKHLQSHMQAAAKNGDLMGLYKAHMMAHAQQLMKKREMMMAQQGGPKGLPGSPGGAAAGVAGTPRPGALPAPGGPRGMQNPPGAINADAMADPGAVGRG